MTRIGAHVSIAKGMPQALDKAQNMGANCIQIFASSPRTLAPPKIDQIKLTEFKKEAAKRDIGPNFIHAGYLINLGTDKKQLLGLSMQRLIGELQFCAAGGFAGVIVHTGSHGGRGFATIVDQVAETVKKILAKTPQESRLLLEIASGGGGKIGSTFEELETLLKAINNKRVGVCLDSAHMFASGIAITSAQDIDGASKKIKETIGWENVWCMHTNDSRGDFGSHIDRHDNIGEGKIGKEPFKRLLHHHAFSQLPFILEVKGFDGKGPDKRNIDILKSLL